MTCCEALECMNVLPDAAPAYFPQAHARLVSHALHIILCVCRCFKNDKHDAWCFAQNCMLLKGCEIAVKCLHNKARRLLSRSCHGIPKIRFWYCSGHRVLQPQAVALQVNTTNQVLVKVIKTQTSFRKYSLPVLTSPHTACDTHASCLNAHCLAG